MFYAKGGAIFWPGFLAGIGNVNAITIKLGLKVFCRQCGQTGILICWDTDGTDDKDKLKIS
jgi:hypothetical protein